MRVRGIKIITKSLLQLHASHFTYFASLSEEGSIIFIFQNLSRLSRPPSPL